MAGEASAGGQKTGLEEAGLVQLRLGHLQMLQGVVSRLAGNSATVKNFSITITAGACALAFPHQDRQLLWIAVGTIVLFAILDAHYLSLERAARRHYEAVSNRALADAEHLDIRVDGGGLLDSLNATLSFSVVGFYLPQLVVVGGLLIYGCWHG